MNLFSRQNPLCSELLILDGISGTGKTMFSPILSELSSVQNPRFEFIFEYLSIVRSFNSITQDAAITVASLMSDIKNYDGLISRDVNFRPGDLSGVLANRNLTKYIRQLFSRDGVYVEDFLACNKATLFLVTHQVLPQILNLFQESPRPYIVEMVRHPLYLVEHWLSYINMHVSSSPRDFTVYLQDAGGREVPWFAHKWRDSFHENTSIINVLLSLRSLQKDIISVFLKQDPRVLFIPFEHFVTDPYLFLERIEAFTGNRFGRSLDSVLKRQKIPRKYIYQAPIKDIYSRYGQLKERSELSNEAHFLSKLSAFRVDHGEECYQILLEISEDYFEHFGRWF